MTSENTGPNGSGSDSSPSNGSASGGSSGGSSAEGSSAGPPDAPPHHTDLPPVRGEPTGIDPLTLARGVAVTRIALGAALLLAPRWVTQPWLQAARPAPDAATAWRVAGSRDIALGVGTVMATKHESSGLRGWLEAGALADGLDVLSLLQDRSLHPAARTACLVPAAATAALSGYLARRLSSPMGR